MTAIMGTIEVEGMLQIGGINSEAQPPSWMRLQEGYIIFAARVSSLYILPALQHSGGDRDCTIGVRRTTILLQERQGEAQISVAYYQHSGAPHGCEITVTAPAWSLLLKYGREKPREILLCSGHTLQRSF